MRKLLAVFLVVSLSGWAQNGLVVTKKGEDHNPTLKITSWEGSESALKYLKHCIAFTDWFDLTETDDFDFQLHAVQKVAGNAIELRLFKGEKAVTAFRRESAGGSVEFVIRHAVDELIKQKWGVPGFCNTKLAMVKEIGRTKEIYLADFDGANPKALTRNGSLSVEPAWSRGGGQLAYTLYNSHRTDVILVDFAKNQQRRIAAFPGLNSAAALSPDGRTAALTLSKDGNPELYLLDVNTRAPKRLTKTSAVESSPCWSPDGSQICYVSNGGGLRPTLYVMSARGGKGKRLIGGGSECVSPDWSATSGLICFAMRVGGAYRIAVMDPNKLGEDPKIVTDAAGDWEAPSWAPDGRHIVCSRTSNGRKGLVLLDSRFGKIIPLAKYTGNDTLPAYAE